ncbi:MAG: hypothetical protein QG632_48 [Candidatus Dependentiae bacterium]|nr:hypothetical protein [Candidatus Dependentiae bacterium]
MRYFVFLLSLITTFILSPADNTKDIATARARFKEYLIAPITREEADGKRDLLYTSIRGSEKSIMSRIDKDFFIRSVRYSAYDKNEEPIFTQALLLNFIYFWDTCKRESRPHNFTDDELETMRGLVKAHNLSTWVKDLRSISPGCIDMLLSPPN